MADVEAKVLKCKDYILADLDDTKLLYVLKKLSQLNITIDILQGTGIGKVVNTLRKRSGSVAEKARQIVHKWKEMVSAEAARLQEEEESANQNEASQSEAEQSANEHEASQSEAEHSANEHEASQSEAEHSTNEHEASPEHSANENYASRSESEHSGNESENSDDQHQISAERNKYDIVRKQHHAKHKTEHREASEHHALSSDSERIPYRSSRDKIYEKPFSHSRHHLDASVNHSPVKHEQISSSHYGDSTSHSGHERHTSKHKDRHKYIEKAEQGHSDDSDTHRHLNVLDESAKHSSKHRREKHKHSSVEEHKRVEKMTVKHERSCSPMEVESSSKHHSSSDGKHKDNRRYKDANRSSQESIPNENASGGYGKFADKYTTGDPHGHRNRSVEKASEPGRKHLADGKSVSSKDKHKTSDKSFMPLSEHGKSASEKYRDSKHGSNSRNAQREDDKHSQKHENDHTRNKHSPVRSRSNKSSSEQENVSRERAGDVHRKGGTVESQTRRLPHFPSGKSINNHTSRDSHIEKSGNLSDSSSSGADSSSSAHQTKHRKRSRSNSSDMSNSGSSHVNTPRSQTSRSRSNSSSSSRSRSGSVGSVTMRNKFNNREAAPSPVAHAASDSEQNLSDSDSDVPHSNRHRHSQSSKHSKSQDIKSSKHSETRDGKSMNIDKLANDRNKSKHLSLSSSRLHVDSDSDNGDARHHDMVRDKSGRKMTEESSKHKSGISRSSRDVKEDRGRPESSGKHREQDIHRSKYERGDGIGQSREKSRHDLHGSDVESKHNREKSRTVDGGKDLKKKKKVHSLSDSDSESGMSDGVADRKYHVKHESHKTRDGSEVKRLSDDGRKGSSSHKSSSGSSSRLNHESRSDRKGEHRNDNRERHRETDHRSKQSGEREKFDKESQRKSGSVNSESHERDIKRERSSQSRGESEKHGKDSKHRLGEIEDIKKHREKSDDRQHREDHHSELSKSSSKHRKEHRKESEKAVMERDGKVADDRTDSKDRKKEKHEDRDRRSDRDGSTSRHKEEARSSHKSGVISGDGKHKTDDDSRYNKHKSRHKHEVSSDSESEIEIDSPKHGHREDKQNQRHSSKHESESSKDRKYGSSDQRNSSKSGKESEKKSVSSKHREQSSEKEKHSRHKEHSREQDSHSKKRELSSEKDKHSKYSESKEIDKRSKHKERSLEIEKQSKRREPSSEKEIAPKKVPSRNRVLISSDEDSSGSSSDDEIAATSIHLSARQQHKSSDKHSKEKESSLTEKLNRSSSSKYGLDSLSSKKPDKGAEMALKNRQAQLVDTEKKAKRLKGQTDSPGAKPTKKKVARVEPMEFEDMLCFDNSDAKVLENVIPTKKPVVKDRRSEKEQTRDSDGVSVKRKDKGSTDTSDRHKSTGKDTLVFDKYKDKHTSSDTDKHLKASKQRETDKEAMDTEAKDKTRELGEDRGGSLKDKHQRKDESRDKLEGDGRNKRKEKHGDKHESRSKHEDKHESRSKHIDQHESKERTTGLEKDKHDGEKDKHKDKHERRDKHSKEKDKPSSRDKDKHSREKDHNESSDKHRKDRDKSREKDKHRGEKDKHKEKHREKDSSRDKDKKREKERRRDKKEKERGRVDADLDLDDMDPGWAASPAVDDKYEQLRSKFKVKKVWESDTKGRGGRVEGTKRKAAEELDDRPAIKKQMSAELQSLLPSTQPHYKPWRYGQPGDRHNMEPIDSSDFIVHRNTRTAVYSGKKHTGTVAEVQSLFDLCIKILQDNIDLIDYVGGIPVSVLKPVLEKCNPTQLYELEDYNPHFLEDSDFLWKAHCDKDFKGSRPDEMESWRELYLRKVDEREQKLRNIRANITKSIAQATPVRKTKMAFVDNVAKPPREVRIQQNKFGTSNMIQKGRDGKKRHFPAVDMISIGRAKQQMAERANKRPMMQKTLQMVKNLKKR